MRGAPPPPWLEPGADADAALLLLARALLPRPAPTRADDVHAGLLRGANDASDGLGADEGALPAAGAAWANAVAGEASGRANVAAEAAWR